MTGSGAAPGGRGAGTSLRARARRLARDPLAFEDGAEDGEVDPFVDADAAQALEIRGRVLPVEGLLELVAVQPAVDAPAPGELLAPAARASPRSTSGRAAAIASTHVSGCSAKSREALTMARTTLVTSSRRAASTASGTTLTLFSTGAAA